MRDCPKCLEVAKNQAWTKLYSLFERVTDSLGKEIDPGIMQAVVGLNAAGIRTIASCEGHVGHGKPYPWIDVSYHHKDKLEQEICQCLERKQQDIRSFLLRRDHLIFEEEQKVAALLHAFYQAHPMAYDRHLITIHLVQGEFRLQPYGGEAQKYRSRSEQTEKLAEYQQEMQCFAKWLEAAHATTRTS